MTPVPHAAERVVGHECPPDEAGHEAEDESADQGRSFQELGPECYAPPGLAAQARHHAALRGERQRARRIDGRVRFPVRSADDGARGEAGRAVSARGRGRPGHRGRGGRAAVRPALQHERPGRDLGDRQHAGDLPGRRRGLRRLPGRHRDGRRAEQQQLRDGPRRRRRGSRHVQLVELDVHATGRQPGVVRGAVLGRALDCRQSGAQPRRAGYRAVADACGRLHPRRRHRDRQLRGRRVIRRRRRRHRAGPCGRLGALPGRERAERERRRSLRRLGAGRRLPGPRASAAQPRRVRRARDDRAERGAATDRRERLPDTAQRARAHLGRPGRLRGRPRQQRRPAQASTAAT